jgi:hypothetical protein
MTSVHEAAPQTIPDEERQASSVAGGLTVHPPARVQA